MHSTKSLLSSLHWRWKSISWLPQYRQQLSTHNKKLKEDADPKKKNKEEEEEKGPSSAVNVNITHDNHLQSLNYNGIQIFCTLNIFSFTILQINTFHPSLQSIKRHRSNHWQAPKFNRQWRKFSTKSKPFHRKSKLTNENWTRES